MADLGVATKPAMTIFERYLSLWVALCIVVGIALGAMLPGSFAAVAEAEVARVNLPVALLVWLMIIPMLLKIDFGALGQVRQHLRGVGMIISQTSRATGRFTRASSADAISSKKPGAAAPSAMPATMHKATQMER